MAYWQEEIQRAVSEERWRRISGVSALSGRSLSIARELYHWREVEACRRNQPARRVLRDDLIIELARRQSADTRQIRAVRGLERNDLAKRLDELAASVQRALDLPEVQWPARIPRDQMPQLSVVGQFLFVALGSLCRQAQLAPNLVGGPNDIRELVAHRLSSRRAGAAVSAAGSQPGGEDAAESTAETPPTSTAEAPAAPPVREGRGRRTPRLARGWREQFLGHFFDDLLAGKTTVRIGDPTSDQPLVFQS
jgi:ribonuclease D